MRSRGERVLIVLRQPIPLLQVDDVVSLTGALPPARVVIILGNLHETELLVVIRADPFGGIDCALLERRVDVACRDLLWHAADHCAIAGAATALAARPTPVAFRNSRRFMRFLRFYVDISTRGTTILNVAFLVRRRPTLK